MSQEDTELEPQNQLRDTEKLETLGTETKGEIESGDYTAQIALQAPVSKRFTGKRLAKRSGPLQQPSESGQRITNNRPTEAHSKTTKRNRQLGTSKLLLTGLGIAAFCFLLSYGIAALFYLSRQVPSSYSSLRQVLHQLSVYSQGNILLILFFIAVVSSLTVLLLAMFLYLFKLLKRCMGAIGSAQAKAEPDGSIQKSNLVLGAKAESPARNNLPDISLKNPSFIGSSITKRTTANGADITTELNSEQDLESPLLQTESMLSATEPADQEPMFPDESNPDIQQKSFKTAKTVRGGARYSILAAHHEPSAAQTIKTRRDDTPEANIPNAQAASKSYDIERQGGQFYVSLQFLLHKKLVFCLQNLAIGLASILSIILTLSFLGQLPNSLVVIFISVFLLIGALFLIILYNQYIQGIEALFQNLLQQIYQYSSPTNSYNQLNAVNMLYALAFVESQHFQERVTTEFQNILKLTRSSWYQTKYSNSPSILVEEVLRKLLSAVNFKQLLFPWRSSANSSAQCPIFSKTNRYLREWLYYQLFLKNFQKFQAFRNHATVSLLSHMAENNRNHRPVQQQSAAVHLSHAHVHGSPRTSKIQRGRLLPHFALDNYYFVGTNLSNLCIKEAHFQNCQLSHSTWANSDLSDCSIISSRLDQVTLYYSSWRRFLWIANTVREIDIEHSFFLQGNIKYCNLQGIQSQQDSHWKMQHCLLQECNLNHSTFCIDAWENVKASSCDWSGALLSLGGEFYHLESENLTAALEKHLEIKI